MQYFIVKKQPAVINFHSSKTNTKLQVSYVKQMIGRQVKKTSYKE